MNFRRLISSLACVSLATATALADPLIGIGVALGVNPTDDFPVVAEVFRNSPAERAGLPKGAIIEKVNGTATAGRTIEECIALIRGPEGIPVLLQFIDPVTGKSMKLMIVRGKFSVETEP